jgi:biopolymer transport protein ExbB
MWPLLACSIVGLTIIILKVIQFGKIQLGQVAFIQPITQAVARGHCNQAIEKLQQNPHPVARVISEAITAGQDITLTEEDRKGRVGRVGAMQIHHLESYLRGLEIVANVSPLIGLLGTVTGMIATFAALEAAGAKADPSLLAGGIWEALITTAFGLFIAIPALAIYYLFEGRIERTRSLMQHSATEILDYLNQRYRDARSENLQMKPSINPSSVRGMPDGGLVRA